MSLFDSGVRPAIDAHLLELSKEVRSYGDYWSASSAFYCQRKVIFERLGVPPVSEDARKQRVFSSGHIFHEWIQNITKEAGLSIAQELELQDEDLMIRGHIDDLVLVYRGDTSGIDDDGNDITERHLILYDYKTAHSKWFEYVKDRPMSHYNRGQLGTYMYMLRNLKVGQEINHSGGFIDAKYMNSWDNKALTEARILKISKDDLRMHEQQLLWSPELESEVVSYWTSLNDHWKKKTLPKCTCADYEKNSKTGVGFMADPRYNPYYFNNEPCSLDYYQQWKETKKEVTV